MTGSGLTDSGVENSNQEMTECVDKKEVTV